MRLVLYNFGELFVDVDVMLAFRIAAGYSIEEDYGYYGNRYAVFGRKVHLGFVVTRVKQYRSIRSSF